jgi:hypothetical protein
MKIEKLSQVQLMQLYERLIQVSKDCVDNEDGKNDRESYIRKNFSLSSAAGKQLYKSLSDEQLIQIITSIADKVGHSPSQKEVFWVWREYIKLRFKKWPYALTAAGLPKSAGKGGMAINASFEMNRYGYSKFFRKVKHNCVIQYCIGKRKN